jgi:LPXTG-site transpeptidase (sortase) family protein
LFPSALRAYRRIERRLGRPIGLGLVLVGVVLLASAGSYYGYSIVARAGLDDLNTSVDKPFTLPADAVSAGFVAVATENPVDTTSGTLASETVTPESPSPTAVATAAPGPMATQSTAESHTTTPEPTTVPAEPVPLSASAFISSYPGIQMHPKYWDRPLWAGTDIRLDTDLPEGYRDASDFGVVGSPDSHEVANRILIPIIGVDSPVNELSIIDLGDSRAYETPKNVVGHIPKTSNPGEAGNGWFFGHLESPIRGEGNVFQNLPQIPGYLNNGDPVYITLETGSGEYLYQVSATQVVHQDDLELYDSDGSTITLVACVPRLVYDHRILVTAELVGVKY